MAQNILESVIETQYLDNGSYDVFVKIPAPYDGGPNSLLVSEIVGGNAFLIDNGQMHTPELTITAYVTKQQDSLLRHLYAATVHSGYIDQRYPIKVEWGDISNSPFAKPIGNVDGLLDESGMDAYDFYLASYTPPGNVSFSSGSLLPVSMVLRLI